MLAGWQVEAERLVMAAVSKAGRGREAGVVVDTRGAGGGAGQVTGGGALTAGIAGTGGAAGRGARWLDTTAVFSSLMSLIKQV